MTADDPATPMTEVPVSQPARIEHRRALAATHPCELYTDHGSARPSLTQGHHRKPVFLQNAVWGGIKDGTLLWLCGTCHDNVHEWLYWLLGTRRKPSPEPPARAKREAQEAFDWYEANRPADSKTSDDSDPRLF